MSVSLLSIESQQEALLACRLKKAGLTHSDTRLIEPRIGPPPLTAAKSLHELLEASRLRLGTSLLGDLVVWGRRVVGRLSLRQGLRGVLELRLSRARWRRRCCHVTPGPRSPQCGDVWPTLLRLPVRWRRGLRGV